MSHRILRASFFVLLLLCSIVTLPLTALASTTHKQAIQYPGAAKDELPVVEPDYIYKQLFLLATRFQHREAGYDAQIPVDKNGHDEFANYWKEEMLGNLQEFSAVPSTIPFPIRGWVNRPDTIPASNVEVTVPGAVHPEQVVVIGCHYDGMATSTQSANDDASGCAIELGVARAMGNYWKQHHLAPQRTLRFVLFDAEEQGLYGSYNYVNATVNGDLNNIVAMFNEEQNGIAYPLRYLGQMNNTLMPFYVDLSPVVDGPQKEKIIQFRKLMAQAVPAVFQQIRELGVQSLTYHGANKQDVTQPVFTADQLSYVKQEDDTLGSSDQVPFTQAGIPCATFVGNSTYYQGNVQASYPYDQPTDTIQLMNTFASGNTAQSAALTMALTLPTLLTTWMLHQPAILGETTSPNKDLTTISDIGRIQTGKDFLVSVENAPPAQPDTTSYNWNFGDGQNATGRVVQHTYQSDGNYQLTLTITSATGVQRISKKLTASKNNPLYKNMYERYYSTGRPPTNPFVKLPKPDATLSDRILLTPNATWTTNQIIGQTSAGGTQNQAGTTAPLPSNKKESMIPEPFLFLAILAGLLLIAGIIGSVLVVRHRHKSLSGMDKVSRKA
ncbi:hypothetical protein KDA_08330 [Dictyobacter alpinus]|uniref:PKD domain-containing protein n=1 Tax=Dictyobacter alpinus TaxID=2014873 RepID=A0A402B1X3_9CHLR|nr:M28 family peptidase [Dictyobacter alpinus]GCE25349.1 hypothetical protein KDA_08330 [Dictyobacter alpinus]